MAITRDLLRWKHEGARIVTREGDIPARHVPQFPKDPNPWLDRNGNRHRARDLKAVAPGGGPWSVGRLLRIVPPQQRG